jgi:hypothetical protein
MAFRVYRAALRSTKAGTQFINTLHFGGDDGVLDFSPLTAQGLADKLGGDADFKAAYKGVLGSGYTFQDVTVREMLNVGDTSIPDQGAHTVNEGGAMSESTPVPPQSMTLILAIKTNAAVRSGHGYIALPSPPRGDVMNQNLWATSGVYWTNVQALIAELGHWNAGGSHWSIGGIDPTSWGLGIYSATRRARGASEYFFHAVSYQARPDIRWRSSRQTAP